GLVRSAQAEQPDALILIDAAEPTDAVLAAALGTGEPQLAVHETDLLMPRLVRAPQPGLVPPAGDAWRLDVTAKGTRETLALLPYEPTGDVPVSMRAGGLNFRDALNALGMYPGDAGAIGLEGAGVVTAAGHGFARGDRVMGLFPLGALGP